MGDAKAGIGRTGWRRGPHSGLWVFGGALVAFRLIFLLAALDPSQERVVEILGETRLEWSHGPERPLYDREELYASTAAEAMRAGYRLPLEAYRFMPYGGGSLLVAILAVPLFAVFGPHYLAFKILALVVTLIGGVTWFLVTRRWLGARAAGGFGLLYILGPPVLVRTALIAKGDHPEAMALLGVIAWLGTRAADSATPSGRKRWGAACGVAAGLGIWVTYSLVPPLAGLAIAAIIATRLRPRSAWLAFGAGVGAGLVPWAVTLATTSGALEVYGQPLLSLGNLTVVSERLGILIGRGLLAGYDVGPIWLHRLAGWLWLIAVIAGAVRWLRRARSGDPPARIFSGRTAVLAAGLGVFAFLLRAPDSSSRYLVPIYPLFLLIVAALVSDWDSRPANARAYGRRLARALAWTVIGFGFLAQANAVADSRFAALRAPLSGVDWPLFGEVAGTKLSADQIRLLPAETRPHFWAGYGQGLFVRVDPSLWRDRVASAGAEAAAKIWEGIGIGWVSARRLDTVAAALPQLSPPEREGLMRGIGRYAEIVFAPLALTLDPLALASLVNTYPAAEQPVVRFALERSAATLSAQSTELHGWTADVAVRVLGREGAARAIGWAEYREIDSVREPRLWRLVENGWVAMLLADDSEIRRSFSYGEGAARAFEWEISRIDPGWLTDPERGLRALAERVSKWGAEDGAGLARACFTALGRVYARELTPGKAAAGDWSTVVPPEYQRDFAAGMRSESRTSAGS